jgi:hypothetical protein
MSSSSVIWSMRIWPRRMQIVTREHQRQPAPRVVSRDVRYRRRRRAAIRVGRRPDRLPHRWERAEDAAGSGGRCCPGAHDPPLSGGGCRCVEASPPTSPVTSLKARADARGCRVAALWRARRDWPAALGMVQMRPIRGEPRAALPLSANQVDAVLGELLHGDGEVLYQPRKVAEPKVHDARGTFYCEGQDAVRCLRGMTSSSIKLLVESGHCSCRIPPGSVDAAGATACRRPNGGLGRRPTERACAASSARPAARSAPGPAVGAQA